MTRLALLALILLALILLAATPALAKEARGKTYRFPVPKVVETEVQRGSDHYTFRWGESPKTALLMIHLSPIQYAPKTFKSMIDTTEANTTRLLKAQANVTDVTTTRTDVALGPFKGTQIEWVVQHKTGPPIRSCSFVLYDGVQIWTGQLTAHSAGDVTKAHALLKRATRIGKRAAAKTGRDGTTDGHR